MGLGIADNLNKVESRHLKLITRMCENTNLEKSYIREVLYF